jgi:hypothetical protein
VLVKIHALLAPKKPRRITARAEALYAFWYCAIVDVACNTSPTTDLMVKRGKAIMFTHNSIGRDPA